MIVFSTSCKQKETESHSHETAETKELYTCSMHPQIIKDKPGNCPICGMKLIAVEKKEGTDADAIMLSDQQVQLGNIQVDTIGKGVIGDETILTATRRQIGGTRLRIYVTIQAGIISNQ